MPYEDLDLRVAIHRLSDVLMHSYPINYAYLDGYCDILGVSYEDKRKGLGDPFFWSVAQDITPRLHRFLMLIHRVDRGLFQTLLAEILRDAVVYQLSDIEDARRKDAKAKRLAAQLDLGLAPLGFAIDIKPNRHEAGGARVTLVTLGTMADQSTATDLGSVLRAGFPAVSEALSAAYSSSSSDDPNQARSAMDQCRNALVNIIEDLSGSKWTEGGLDRIPVGSSGAKLVKNVHAFLSGKGWAHGRDYPDVEEIWMGIRCTESCLVYLLWCTGKWSGSIGK